MKKLKIAIIGCGRIFEKHKNAIEKLNNQYEIESICDLKLNKIKKKNLLKKLKYTKILMIFVKIQMLN